MTYSRPRAGASCTRRRRLQAPTQSVHQYRHTHQFVAHASVSCVSHAGQIGYGLPCVKQACELAHPTTTKRKNTSNSNSARQRTAEDMRARGDDSFAVERDRFATGVDVALERPVVHIAFCRFEGKERKTRLGPGSASAWGTPDEPEPASARDGLRDVRARKMVAKEQIEAGKQLGNSAKSRSRVTSHGGSILP